MRSTLIASLATHLHYVALAVLTAIWPGASTYGDADAISRAIGVAVAEDSDRGYVDLEAEAATMAVYAWYESRLSMHPTAYSWDAVAGHSCGAWQMPCALTRYLTLEEQAKTWLRWTHQAGLAGVDSSPARARKRVGLAMRLLRGAN